MVSNALNDSEGRVRAEAVKTLEQISPGEGHSERQSPIEVLTSGIALQLRQNPVCKGKPMNHDQSLSSIISGSRTTRRQFLQQTSGLAAGASVLGPFVPEAKAEDSGMGPAMPTIQLGQHRVTKLIIGGNPIYGYSHFNHLFSEHQRAWHTPERVVELLKHCERQGLNTWQCSYSERTLADLDLYRSAGGTMQWFCLGRPDWDQHLEMIDDAIEHKAIGVAPHGALAERLHRQNKLSTLTDLLKRIRDVGSPKGCLVGLSAHNPALIELAEEKGWDVECAACTTSPAPWRSFGSSWAPNCRWERFTCPATRPGCLESFGRPANPAWSLRCWPQVGGSIAQRSAAAVLKRHWPASSALTLLLWACTKNSAIRSRRMRGL